MASKVALRGPIAFDLALKRPMVTKPVDAVQRH